jgi:enoyl-CoA hydratase
MDYSRYKFIKVERKDKLAVFTLNRPEALNAINAELHTELEDIFADVAQD